MKKKRKQWANFYRLYIFLSVYFYNFYSILFITPQLKKHEPSVKLKKKMKWAHNILILVHKETKTHVNSFLMYLRIKYIKHTLIKCPHFYIWYHKLTLKHVVKGKGQEMNSNNTLLSIGRYVLSVCDFRK